MSSDSYGDLKNNGNKIYITTQEQNAQEIEHISSRAAVLRALAANIGIATIKIVCWLLSGSSTMLSEAIHSGVDSFNSLCLLVGLKRGSKPADRHHPYGYGLEANVWALFACVLMLVGTGIALYSGFERLFYNHHEIYELLANYHIIAVTLVGSIIFESWAVSSASTAVLNEAGVYFENRIQAFLKSFKYIRKIKSPTTKFVWYEDTAALTGVIVAFIALSISKFFVVEEFAYIPDAIASIIIGCILLFLAIYLIKYNIYSLTGAAAGPQTEKLIRDLANRSHGVSQLHDLKTIDMGSSGLIINMKIEVDPDTPVKDADNIAEDLEVKIKNNIKNVSHVTIEMLANDEEENWEEKFLKVVDEGKELGLLKPHEANMFSKFYDFTDTVVREIMVPRTEVTFVDTNCDINYMIDLIINSGHTRIPIYRDNMDNIIGVINAKDVLRAIKESNYNDVLLEDLAREISIVPENKPISDMLNEFTSGKNQIAAVIDEHGGVSGIVTVEDILEEIVGEIYDEFDVVQAAEIEAIDENIYSVAAKMDIEDVNEKLDLELSSEDFQTIGGYVFGLLGREPEEGHEIIDEETRLKFKVLTIDGHKITRVIVYKDFEISPEEKVQD